MLLAMDTSTQWMGLALYDGVRVLNERIWQTMNHHTVELAPAVGDLLQYSGVQKSSIQAIGLATGPGSFTSLRIGLALAKGMALALHIPLIGIPTLDILAGAQPPSSLPMAVILQAGRGRLAVGWYEFAKDRWQVSGEVVVLSVDQLSQRIRKPTIICGELTLEERALLERKRKRVVLATPAQALRRPSFLAEFAWRDWQNGRVDDPISLSPKYLHVAEPIPD